ncbi:hypothetical protein [Terriglobus saanensis]|uniref:Uncharacterized protein n=1 Tax=Terriglobus saanensis (strain ATCC BAA-1853 / DSM 23119 / SP1PR4) TaxID=401053 RepID=E8V680_TERSS|nr:hypothetical protein [Terriglobus saanensis]ADV84971.1 hypothetical protein AciPR4_4227 [Terriglobus saanensis SP1PR4]
MLPYIGPEMVKALQSRTNTPTPSLGPLFMKQARVVGAVCNRAFRLLSRSTLYLSRRSPGLETKPPIREARSKPI